MFIKYFRARFFIYKQCLLELQTAFLKANIKMRKKSRTAILSNYTEDLLENKENMEEIVIFKDNPKKHFSQCSEKKLKNNVSKTKSKSKLEKVENIGEEKQKAKPSNNVVLRKRVKVVCYDDNFEDDKPKKNNAKKMKKQPILFGSTQSAKVELKKQCIPGISSQSEYKLHDNNIMEEIVVFKDNPKKHFSKCSEKKLKNNVGTKSKSKLEKVESIGEEKQKAKPSNNVVLRKQVKVVYYDDNFEDDKPKKNNAKKMRKQPILFGSTQSAKVESKKQCIPEISNESEYKLHDINIMKEAVVLLENYETVKNKSICSMCDDHPLTILDNDEKAEKEILSKCECHASFLIKEAVVILERFEDIKKDNINPKSHLSLNVMLEDSGKAKMVPNKSGKGTKRKKEEKSKTEDDNSSKSKLQKVSGPSKSKKREDIPDVSAIDFNNDSKSASGNPWNLKISSWNVNGIRAWLEKNGLSYLHHEQPDILCIQETKCSDDKLPGEMRKIEGYHTYWLAGDKEGYSGVGLLTKEKPIKVEYGINISEHDNEGRVITAEYDKFYLVSTYVPNAGRGLVRLDYRMKWDKDFREYLKKLDAEKPVILCGDLNVAHEEIDLANPKTNKKNAGFTKEEREGFSALLKEGFIDTFRQLYPNVKGAYTFWTYMMNARAKNVGWRLDYFVVSERFTENLCDNVIRKDVFGSDHCPVTLFLSV